MDFFEHLNLFLKNDISVAEVFGDRIFPIFLKQNASYPAMACAPVSATYDKNIQCESGFNRQVVQFSICDKTFGKARRSSRILKEVFKDFHYSLAGLPIETTHCISDNIVTNNSKESFDTDEYCGILEYEFQFNKK